MCGCGVRHASECVCVWMVLQAGMAGGTGRGAAPVVAHLAQQAGAVTFSLAVLPAPYRDAPEDEALVSKRRCITP